MDNHGGTVYLGSNEGVAKRLGITPAGLRRLADIYGEVYGPLQRDTHYNNRRLWTLEAVERLEAARALVRADRARSIKAALLLLQSGSEPSQESLMLPSKEVSKDPLLLEVLEHVRRLETRLEDMQKQLQALPAPQEASQAEYVARLEQLYAEADKRAQYAMDELKRRDEAVARKRRPWWPWRREP